MLVDEELARAIRQESAAAIKHWWRVGAHRVWQWRTAFDATRTNNPGSQRLIRAASAQGADMLRGVPLSQEQVEMRRRNAINNDQAQYLRSCDHDS
jgi:hypothetical protein